MWDVGKEIWMVGRVWEGRQITFPEEREGVGGHNLPVCTISHWFLIANVNRFACFFFMSLVVKFLFKKILNLRSNEGTKAPVWPITYSLISIILDGSCATSHHWIFYAEFDYEISFPVTIFGNEFFQAFFNFFVFVFRLQWFTSIVIKYLTKFCNGTITALKFIVPRTSSTSLCVYCILNNKIGR